MVTRIHLHTKFGVVINLHEKRDFVKTRVGIILSLVIGAIWCFGFFGGYANAEDLMGVREKIFSESKITVEGNLRREIIKLKQSGQGVKARAREYRLKRIIEVKREYREKMEKEERRRQSAASQKYLKKYFPNKNNEWTPNQKIAFGVSSLMFLVDMLQTANMPGRSEPPIKSVSAEQRARMSAEEIIEAYKYTEYHEGNNMPFFGLGWWFGKNPSNGEISLFYVAGTAAWFAACHFGPILYDKACNKVPAIGYIVPDIIEDNLRNIMLGSGIANHSYWVLSNLRVTNKGIAISHEF